MRMKPTCPQLLPLPDRSTSRLLTDDSEMLQTSYCLCPSPFPPPTQDSRHWGRPDSPVGSKKDPAQIGSWPHSLPCRTDRCHLWMLPTPSSAL